MARLLRRAVCRPITAVHAVWVMNIVVAQERLFAQLQTVIRTIPSAARRPTVAWMRTRLELSVLGVMGGCATRAWAASTVACALSFAMRLVAKKTPKTVLEP